MLRQVAVLLERENDKLHAKLQTLTAELARLRGDTRPAAELELEFLKELLPQRERALFGASSAQRPRPAPAAPGAPPAARAAGGPPRGAPPGQGAGGVPDPADRRRGPRARRPGPDLPAAGRDAARDA